MGESERSKAGRGLFTELGQYKPKYSSQDILGQLDKATQTGIGSVRTGAQTDIARKTSATAGSLRSRGITKGSIFDDTISGSTEPIREQAGKSIDSLNLGRLGQTAGVMKDANDFDFKKMLARLQSLGLLDDTTTGDDIFAALNAVGNVAKGVGSIPGLFK